MSEENITNENENENAPQDTPEVNSQDSVESENPIFNALFKVVEDELPQEEEVQEPRVPKSLNSALYEIENGDEEVSEAPAEPPETESEETPVAEEKPKRKAARRKRKIIDPNPQQSKAPDFVPEPMDEDLTLLTAEEKERYDLAKWAAKNEESLKGKDKEYLEFFKSHKSYIEERLREDPDLDLAEDDQYRSFVRQNKVDFDAPNVLRKKLKHEAKAEALEEMKPEQEKIRQELNRIKNQPKAKEVIKEKKGLITKAIPKEIFDAFKGDKDWAKNNKLEAGIVDRVLGDAYAMVDAFYNISHDLVSFDQKNPVHARLSKWIDDEQSSFVNGGKTRRNGKIFIRRERVASLSEADRASYYTFSDDDLMSILAKRAKSSMEGQIKSTLSDLEKAGFSRGQVAVQPERAIPSPKTPAPSPRPNSAISPSKPGDNKVLELLGM